MNNKTNSSNLAVGRRQKVDVECSAFRFCAFDLGLFNEVVSAVDGATGPG